MRALSRFRFEVLENVKEIGRLFRFRSVIHICAICNHDVLEGGNVCLNGRCRSGTDKHIVYLDLAWPGPGQD